MRQLRFVLVAIGLGISTTHANVQVASSEIVPGTYRSPGFTTTFDGKGNWMSNVDSGYKGGGHYAIDGDVIAFATSPPSCPDERTRYRIHVEPKGFRLEFLDDHCKRPGVNITFERVAAQVAK